MPDILEVAEGLRYQTKDERRAYSITTTNVVSSPTTPTVVAYDEATETVVTNTVFPVNEPGVSGDVISLSVLRDLTPKHTYRIEVKWIVGAGHYERYFRVYCPR